MGAHYEGCFSTGPICGRVTRPKTVTVRALDRFGNEVVETHHDYVARIFQHEIDHLNGVRFPEQMGEDEMIDIVGPDEIAKFRQTNGIGWEKKQPVADWKDWI